MINEDYLQKYHPECVVLNADEVEQMCRVIRDEEGNIIDDLHRTTPIMTKYEKTRILGVRAAQLAGNADIYCEIPANIIDEYLIAEEEFKQGKLDFIIRRIINTEYSEYWHMKDMIYS